MPILNFNNTKAAAYQQQLIDITRNRSTESTVDATGGGGGPKPQGFPDHDEPVEVSLTPPTSPSHKQAHHHPLGSWRNKEMNSIVRTPPRNNAASYEQEDLWTLQRCNAFDEDD